MTPARLVLYSRLAFYPVHWQALEQIVSRYDVQAFVLAAPAPELPSVHQAHGSAEPADGEIDVSLMPAGTRRERAAWLARQLRQIGPDAIWVQEEPIDPPGWAEPCAWWTLGSSGAGAASTNASTS